MVSECEITPVFIIVVTFNGERDMPRFMSSFKQYTKLDDVELVVVDNNSSDTTISIIEKEYPQATIFRNTENLGFTGGNNIGMTYALSQGARYVMLVNQDIIFGSGWLDPLVRTLDSHPTIAAVQPRILLHPQTDRVNSLGNALHYLGFGYTIGYTTLASEAVCVTGTPLAYCSFAAVLLSASALRRVGLFDESFFMYHEDSDLCWRMRLMGYVCTIASESQVFHHYEFSRSIKKFYLIERNRFLILLKNYSLKTLLLIAPLLFVWEVGLVGYSLLGLITQKRTIGFKEKMQCYAYFFSPTHWRSLLQQRRMIQEMRILPDKDIVRNFTATIAFQDIENPVLAKIANPITEWYWRRIQPLL